MIKANVSKDAKKSRTAGRVTATVSAVALATGISIAAAPAALADDYGYLNCHPNGSTYMEVFTRSSGTGNITHVQRDGTTTTSTFWHGAGATVSWTANKTTNSSSSIYQEAWAWLWSSDRYCW